MHELYELKEMLCKELEEYGKKGEMTAGTLDVVDKLAHTIKNISKIIENYEDEEYSGYYDMAPGEKTRNYNRNGSYEGRKGSYARRRSGRGRYSNEGYSRATEDIVLQLNEIMEEAPENMKHEIKRLITKMETM